MSAPAPKPASELRQRLVKAGPFLGLLAVVLFFAVASGAPERYLSANNLRVVLAQTVIVALGAIGMTLVIVGGGIDLAVGSTIALTGVLCALALLPSMPKLPFLALGGAAGAIGWRMRKTELQKSPDAAAADQSKPAAGKENVEALMRVEPLAIEVGLGLVGLVEGAQESPLLRRISAIRRQFAQDLGFLLPPVRVADNLALRSREYVISLKGVERGSRPSAIHRTTMSRSVTIPETTLWLSITTLPIPASRILRAASRAGAVSGNVTGLGVITSSTVSC